MMLDLDAIAALCATESADPGALAEHVPALLAMARRAEQAGRALAAAEAERERYARIADELSRKISSTIDDAFTAIATVAARAEQRGEAIKAVLRASVDLRRIESAPVPGESIAELEANVPAAQRRSMVALTKWRGVMDEHMAVLRSALGEEPSR